MAEKVTLIGREWVGAELRETRRDVLAAVRSVGYREFYASSATDYHPDVKLVLSDYLDYDRETLAEYDGELYRIIRTYRTGQSLELTCERAPDEEPTEVDADE